MQRNKNERGSVLVFVTLMMVLLFVMVGLGLDTGHLAYIRAQGQPAVDAAALAAVNALPTLSINEVNNRAAQLNYNSGSNAGGNNYLNSPNNLIGANNITLINYDNATGTITKAASIASANGVRVALETSNPYDGAAAKTPMKAPLFLTPLLNLMGQNTKGTQSVSVSAVAVLTAIPGMPVAISGCDVQADGTCAVDCRPASANCATDPVTGLVIGDGTPANPFRNCKLLQVSSSNNGNGDPSTDNGRYQDSGWTTFGVPSANAPSIQALVRNNSTCGNIPPTYIGQGCIYLNNGQITPVLSEFDDVYSKNNSPNGFVGPWSSGSPNPVAPEDWGVIPVVRKDLGNFNGCETVRSFARFGIRDVIKSGNDKYLIGDLICNRSLNELGGTGCYTTQLVRDTKSGM